MTKRLVTINGASTFLGISRWHIRKMIAAGILPGPIATTRLYSLPHILAALNAAGMSELVRPESRS